MTNKYLKNINSAKRINTVITIIAMDLSNDYSSILRELPFIQKELLRRKVINLNNLTDDQIDNLSESSFIEEWVSEQNLIKELQIHPLTLQSFCVNGSISFTIINHNKWYYKKDIEHIFNNYHVKENLLMIED